MKKRGSDLMNELIERIDNELERYEEYKDMKISYILKDKSDYLTNIIYTNDKIGIEVNPFTLEIYNIFDWDFSLENYVFKELENDKKIAYMSFETHNCIWNLVNNYYPEDINYKDGMYKYINYCEEKNITKEIIDKNTNLNTPNIMTKKFLEKSKLDNKNNEMER